MPTFPSRPAIPSRRIAAACLLAALLAASAPTAPAMDLPRFKQAQGNRWVVSLPFAWVRPWIVQPDGVPGVVWRGRMNRWPQAADPFMRDEVAEFAIGKALKADPADKRCEIPLPEGLSIRDGHLRVVGGWRVHKDVFGLGDLYDGTFASNVYLAVENGRLRADLRNAKLRYGAGPVGRALGGPFLLMLETLIARHIERDLEAALMESAENSLGRVPGKTLLSVGLRPGWVDFTLGAPTAQPIGMEAKKF